jgi:hypothetical protein
MKAKALTVQRKAVVGAGCDGHEPGPRPPAGGDHGGHVLVGLAPGPEAAEHAPSPRVHLTVTGEGERVGLAGGHGDHLGRHLRRQRGAAVEWTRGQMRRSGRKRRARVQLEALPREQGSKMSSGSEGDKDSSESVCSTASHRLRRSSSTSTLTSSRFSPKNDPGDGFGTRVAALHHRKKRWLELRIGRCAADGASR